MLIFFFQAEDGIRDLTVTGVQTCALPIWIACAKVTEAEPFVAAGCRDVVIAYPVVGHDKWQKLARMAREAKVTVNVDSAAAVRGISEAAGEAGAQVQGQVGVDSGFHRGGFPY